MQSGMKSVGGSLGIVSEGMEGLGDKAYMVPGGLHTFVLKGDTMFALSFAKFAPNREKATALCTQVLGRL
jgi:hypothetical protein